MSVAFDAYKRVTLKMLEAREGGMPSDDIESAYMEELDELWGKLDEDEVSDLRLWVRQTMSRRDEK